MDNLGLLVYPAYLDNQNFQLAPEISVTSRTPRTMLIHTHDDKPFINSSLSYYYALTQLATREVVSIPYRGHYMISISFMGDYGFFSHIGVRLFKF